MSSESLRPSVQNNLRFCQQVDIQSDTTLRVGEFSRPRSCTGLIVCVLAKTQCLFLSLLTMKTAKIMSGSRRNEAELWRSLPTTLCLPIECRRKRLVKAEFAAIAIAHNIRKMIAKGHCVCSEVGTRSDGTKPNLPYRQCRHSSIYTKEGD